MCTSSREMERGREGERDVRAQTNTKGEMRKENRVRERGRIAWLSIKNGTLKWKIYTFVSLKLRLNIASSDRGERQDKSQSTQNKEDDRQSTPCG